MGLNPSHCDVCIYNAKELLLPDPTITEEHTGGSSGYYRVKVRNPTTIPTSYKAECNDIIESLEMTFAEGNVFKAIWRSAAARQGKEKKGNNSVYDAEKMVFFSERILAASKED
jgi:hypothetical protein